MLQENSTDTSTIQEGLRAAMDSVGAELTAFREIEWSGLINWVEVIQNGVRIVLILFLAFAAYRVLRMFTRRLQREIDEPDLSRKRLREQRAQTVASLMNNVALIVITGLAILMILGTFIEIGPLLAGVGVLGLAVSFGAQSLVKDLISGAFMLVEGQFAVGDVVRVKETAGMVEKITLRTIVLRDIHGIVHIIPNGTVDTLSNLTKSWSRATLDLGVAYKEDVDRVMEVVMDEAMTMFDDPDWRPLLVEEPVVPGVQDFVDSAVLIRVQFKTLPLKQWDVGREFRRRIKNRFDAEGIEIPFPHTTVYWGQDQHPAGTARIGPGPDIPGDGVRGGPGSGPRLED